MRKPNPAFSPAELAEYDGAVRQEIYISFCGKVYDVTKRPDLYGKSPPGPYHILAGRECARSLSTMSLNPADVGREDISEISGLLDKLRHAMGEEEVRQAVDKAMKDWQKKLDENYTVVGTLAKPKLGVFLPAPRASGAAPLSHHARTLAAAPAASSSIVPHRGPGPLELVARKPRAYLQRNFVSPAECKSLISMILQRQEGSHFEKKVRARLEVDDPKWSEEQRDLILSVETRLADLTGGPMHSEETALVGTLTPPDRLLHEASVADHLGLHVDTNQAQWRFCTAIIYLSSLTEGLSGGETIFPAALPLSEGLPTEDEEEAIDAAGCLLDLGLEHTDKALNVPASDILSPAQSAKAVEAATKLLQAASPAGTGLRVKPEEGSVCIFWTRQDDGEVDRFSFHGGAPVVFSGRAEEGVGSVASGWKWTLQKFKEVPLETRHSPAALADFVRKTRSAASKRHC